MTTFSRKFSPELISRFVPFKLFAAPGDITNTLDTRGRKDFILASQILHTLRAASGQSQWVNTQLPYERFICRENYGDLCAAQEFRARRYKANDIIQLRGKKLIMSLEFTPGLSQTRKFKIVLSARKVYPDEVARLTKRPSIWAEFETSLEALQCPQNLMATSGRYRGLNFEDAVARILAPSTATKKSRKHVALQLLPKPLPPQDTLPLFRPSSEHITPASLPRAA